MEFVVPRKGPYETFNKVIVVVCVEAPFTEIVREEDSGTHVNLLLRVFGQLDRQVRRR